MSTVRLENARCAGIGIIMPATRSTSCGTCGCPLASDGLPEIISPHIADRVARLLVELYTVRALLPFAQRLELEELFRLLERRW